jgi:hypothetical protein
MGFALLFSVVVECFAVLATKLKAVLRGAAFPSFFQVTPFNRRAAARGRWRWPRRRGGRFAGFIKSRMLFCGFGRRANAAASSGVAFRQYTGQPKKSSSALFGTR